MAWNTVTGLKAEDGLVLVCDGCGDIRTWSRAALLKALGDADLNAIGTRPELCCRKCGGQPSRGWFTWQLEVH